MSDFLQRLEDKVLSLVSEVEALREANKRLLVENDELKQRTETESDKLRGILSLLDGVDSPKETAAV